MKKIILSFLLCMGVGFTMMGSPARVGDDDNSSSVKSDAAVLTVTTLNEKPVAPVQHGKGLIKHPWKVKKINVTKLKVSKTKIDWNKYRVDHLQVWQNNILINRVAKPGWGSQEQGIPRRPDPRKGGGTGTQSSGTIFDFTTRPE